MSVTLGEVGGRPEDSQLGEFFDFNEATEPQVDTSGKQDNSDIECLSHPTNRSVSSNAESPRSVICEEAPLPRHV